MEEENKNKKNKMIMIAVVAIIIIVIVAVGGFVFAGDRQSDVIETEVSNVDSSLSEEDSSTVEESDEVTSDGDVKEFDLSAKQWEFNPSTITVNQGDQVRLNITSIDVTHGFAIPDFGVSETLRPNSTVTVEFNADKKGTFRFFCTVVCGSGHLSMDGTLTVE